jgi:hypothetical protein
MTAPIDVNELLALARETLQADLTPALPAHARFTAAMVANALAIAAREAQDHSDADHDIAAARAALSQVDDAALILSIRYGELDDPSPQRTAAMAYAAALVRRRLAVTNPSRLSAQPESKEHS